MKPSDLIHGSETRLFTLRPPVAGTGLLLDQFSGTESVSGPFRFTLRLLSERGDLALADFLARPMGLSLRTADGGARSFHGHVTGFRHCGSDGGLAEYEAALGPWTDFLQHRVNCKVFQHKNLPDLLRELFADYQPLARWESRLDEARYPPLPFCVQYRESDFSFMSRLLEAHGVHYHFRFEPEGHVLVLADDSTLAPALPGIPRIAFNSLPGAATEDTIDTWTEARQLAATAHATRSFDFTSPREPIQAREPTRLPAPGPAMEHYEPAGSYGFKDLEAGAALARRRMEEHELRGGTFHGGSNCRALACGHRFELLDHYRRGATVHDRQYFITGVSHAGRNNHRGRAEADYRNSFTCVPLATRYRPPLATPRPLVHGPQTAIVVGPPGEEIHCDRHGRVRIQFHWDRLGARDDASSCWVRVSSPWAGSRFGFIALPRIGQEVVVEFLDGDPDRPLITGCVYNELHRPPWELPGQRTQSGVLTRSSRDGDHRHASALRFEDRKGAEEVWLHAEKDQRIEVEHDESHRVDHDRAKTVGHDETTAVGHDRTETVGNDETISVAMNRTERVGASEQVAIGINQRLQVGAAQEVSVGATQSIHVGAAKDETVLMASTEQVGGVRTLTVGEAYLVTVGGAKNEAVGLGSMEEVGLDKLSAVGKRYTITAGDQLEIKVGKASLLMTQEGRITLSGTELSIEGAGPVQILGKNVAIN